jgi:hypothetical protein
LNENFVTINANSQNSIENPANFASSSLLHENLPIIENSVNELSQQLSQQNLNESILSRKLKKKTTIFISNGLSFVKYLIGCMKLITNYN